MSFFLANSLIDGFLVSDATGKVIVLLQIISSIFMGAAIFGKINQLKAIKREMKRFMRDFLSGHDVLEYYLNRRPSSKSGLEGIYKETCERLLKLFSPDTRTLLMGRNVNSDGEAALTAREIELVRGSCEHALDEVELCVEYGMGAIATVVALSPMLGLLGTVWGVLDAFYAMGSAGSANLATIAPSISSALVTTVVGLLIAIPGVACYNMINGDIRKITSSMEGFADELIGRVACEFQGRSA